MNDTHDATYCTRRIDDKLLIAWSNPIVAFELNANVLIALFY